MALGGVTAMVFGTRMAYSTGLFFRKVDLRSMFFATVFLIILFVLAYLTNPSESSFRTFLTEQSFRQHLSRLDETAQDDHADREDSGVHYSLARRIHPAASKPPRDAAPGPPFHFAKRASVSLRTPKHIFRSFGVFTVAAVCPARAPHPRPDALAPPVADSWFVGAFGKWWRGGTLPPWCSENVATKDAERCASGILDLKALDSLEGYDGLPFPASHCAGLLPANGSAKESPKSRPSERSAQRTTSTTSRSTTPPPLPKSASLPLHAPRVPATPPKPERTRASPSPAHTPQAPDAPAPPSSLFDQSPVIADVLRQISASSAAVHDLRAALSDFRAQAAAARTATQADLDAQRERKRAEDAARGDTKAQTKRLEDQKRGAEARRRDVEKRLKAAEGQRDGAARRIERLDMEIAALHGQRDGDRAAVLRAKAEGAAAEKEIAVQLEMKRREIGVAEDVVAALSARARELEERVAQEEKRLQRARDEAELRKQDRSFFPLHVVSTPGADAAGPWSPIAPYDQPYPQDPHAQISSDFSADIDIFAPVFQGPSSRSSSGSEELKVSPQPRQRSPGGISALREQLPASDDSASMYTQSQSYSTLLSAPSTRFSPFSDNDLDIGGEGLSPRTSSLIPSSLITSLDSGGGADELSCSFQSDRDDVLARNWRDAAHPPHPVEAPAFNSSPTSITNPSFDGVDQEDPFEIRPPPAMRQRVPRDAMDLQRAFFQPNRTVPLPAQPLPPLARARSHEEPEDKAAAHRRWFSADPKDRARGLNPEAAVFRLARTPPDFAPGFPAAASTLSLPSMRAPWSARAMRAFAPSPAEREALRAGLGSTNGSLERLPTLSEVAAASMPPSPVPVHAATVPQPQPPIGTGRASVMPNLSWLQLPRRKHKFSPWDEGDEVVPASVSGASE